MTHARRRMACAFGTLLANRKSMEALLPDDIASFLAQNRARISTTLRTAGDRLEAGALAAAETALIALRDSLLQHVRSEEDVLLPVFDARTLHLAQGRELRHQHSVLRQHLDAFARALDRADARLARERFLELRSAIDEHQRLEAALLASELEPALSADERRALARWMRAE